MTALQERARLRVQLSHAEADISRAARLVVRYGEDSRKGRAAMAELEAARDNKRRALEKLSALEVPS